MKKILTIAPAVVRVAVTDTEQYDEEYQFEETQLDENGNEVTVVKTAVRTLTRDVTWEESREVYQASERDLNPEQDANFDLQRAEGKESAATRKRIEVKAAAVRDYLEAKAIELASSELAKIDALLIDGSASVDDIKAVEYVAAK